MSISARPRTAWRHGAIAATALLWLAAPVGVCAQQNPWAFAGSDIGDTHAAYSAVGSHQLTVRNVGSLRVKWSFTTSGSVSATPTVEAGGLYVPDWSGMLYKINPNTGARIWSHRLSEYTGNPRSVTRVSPAIAGNSIIVGDQVAARVTAVNKTTGALVWSTVVETHAYARITSSPVVYNGVIYLGVASGEEDAAITVGYVPSFRGSIVALSAATGAVLWKVYTVPAGYAGGAVWGSSLAISAGLGLLFAGTGNNYAVPADRVSCMQTAASGAAQLACLDPTDYVDTVLAISLADHTVRWSRRLHGADTWTSGCEIAGEPDCPKVAGTDADFAAAPNLVSLAKYRAPDDRGGTSTGLLLGAAEKSGSYWALNPSNGGLLWSNHTAAAEFLWGAAAGDLFDRYYTFVGIDNDAHLTTTYKGQYGGQPLSWSGGGWEAINLYSGQTVWQIPASSKDLVSPQHEANAPGFVSFLNGMVFAGDTGGTLFAINGHTGLVLWRYSTGATVQSAPALFNDTLYWGVGYPHAVEGHTLYAFAVP